MASKNNIYDILIWVVSILVPVVVALLLFTKWEYDQLVFDMRIPNYDPIILMDNLPNKTINFSSSHICNY